jgi:hypothetical protein
MSDAQDPEVPEADVRETASTKPSADARPVLPDRSSDETDVGWGDPPEPDDRDRLQRDRPPHWNDY